MTRRQDRGTPTSPSDIAPPWIAAILSWAGNGTSRIRSGAETSRTERPPAPTDARTMTVPTLIIWGHRDDLLPGQDQRQLAAAISGSRLVVYQDTGHLVLWEQPDRVPADLTLSSRTSRQHHAADRGAEYRIRRCAP
jgi:pimeloyl-ACP methyl ester carboxylesterase